MLNLELVVYLVYHYHHNKLQFVTIVDFKPIAYEFMYINSELCLLVIKQVDSKKKTILFYQIM